MSKIKRALFPETYELIDGIKECEHLNFNEYFEKCDDCGELLEDLPPEMQDAWRELYDDV